MRSLAKLKRQQAVIMILTQIKGFKKKEGKRGTKWFKGWVECQPLKTKTKKLGGSSTSQVQEHMV